MARENFNVDALYNITKNQDNPIKTVRRTSWNVVLLVTVYVFTRSLPVLTVRLSVRLSVCPCSTETAKRRITQTTPDDSQRTLVF